MSSVCSKAEIAEKKRLALEKLKAKKLTSVQQQQSIPSSVPVSARSTAETGAAAQTKVPLSFSATALCKPSVFYGQSNNTSTQSPQLQKTNNSYQQQQHSSSNRDKYLKNSNTKQTIAPVYVRAIRCTCYMINDARFVVNMPQWDQRLIDLFKKMPSKSYDPATKIWSFNISDYNELQKHAKELMPNIVLEEIPKNVLNLFTKPKDDLSEYISCLASIESKLVNTLLPFQKEGICFGISKNGRVMIADEMGLGKTIQSLGIAHFYKEDWPLLICTTASTRNSWVKHVRDLLPTVPCHHVVCLTDGNQPIFDAKIVITSYALLEKHVEVLLPKGFGAVIFDESHSLKNHEAKRTNNCDRLALQARRIMLLTGTPALSRPVELFSQLKMIDRKFFNFRNYTTRYCDGKQGSFGWDASGQSNLPELNAVLNRKFMIRRVKNDVLPDLVEKNRETVLLDASLIQLDDVTKKDFNEYESKLSLSTKKNSDILLTYYSRTAEIKTKAVCSYVKSLLKEDVKFLIFAHHKVMMNALSECLNKEKADYIRIDGSTRNDLRNDYINRFQTKTKCKVALLSLHACNSGITLTAAQLVVFAELDWNPSTLAQAESRAHRIGQMNIVTCRYLLAPNTADDLIWKMLKEKQNVLNTAGLFCDDLQDGEVRAVPSSSKTPKIDKFLNITKRKIINYDGGHPDKKLKESDENKNETNVCNNEFQSLLEEDDDDLCNLNLDV